MKKILFIFLLVFLGCENDSSTEPAESILDDSSIEPAESVLGCTDIVACNYDSLATEDDESCYYPVDNCTSCATSEDAGDGEDLGGCCGSVMIAGDSYYCNFSGDLYINDKGLNEIPEGVFKLLYLEKIFMSNNNITSIPEEIGNLKYLITIEAYNNQISSIHENIGNCDSLHILKVSDNQLTSLPNSISNLSEMLKIEAENNNITYIPENIGNLNQLKNLWLSNNSITTIPSDIGELTSLEDLRVSENQITSIPTSLASLQSLKWFHAHTNNITELPRMEYENMESLTNMYLFNNQISSFPMPYLEDGSVDPLSVCSLPQSSSYVRIEIEDNALCYEYSMHVHEHTQINDLFQTMMCPQGQTTQTLQVSWGNSGNQQNFENCCEGQYYNPDTGINENIENWQYYPVDNCP